MLIYPPNPAPAAKKLLRYEFSAPVLFFQVLGFVACCLIAPYGYWGGIFLVIVGSFLEVVFQCSLCRKSVARSAAICRHCGAVFTEKVGKGTAV